MSTCVKHRIVMTGFAKQDATFDRVSYQCNMLR
jgi:hypothetical protein